MRKRSLALLLSALLCSTIALHAQQVEEPDTTVIVTSDVPAYDSGETDATEVEAPPRYTFEEAPPVGRPLPADSSAVAVRPLPALRLNKARAEDDFWYWNYRAPRRTRHEQRSAEIETGSGKGFSVPNGLFWVLIAIGILALLFLLLQAMNINPFARKAVALAEDGEPESAEDFFSRDFESAVQRALAAGDQRLAIRLRYLQVLRELADRNIIQYRQGATNGVYVSQLWGSRYYDDFFRITRTFEYAWYGMLPVTQAAFDRMQQDVDHLKNRFA